MFECSSDVHQESELDRVGEDTTKAVGDDDVVCCNIHRCWITPTCKVAGDALILKHVLWLPWRWGNAGNN